MTQSGPAHYTWWLAGRSAGLVAMLLVTAAVLLGLALAAKVIPARRRAATLRVHQHLALVSLGAIAAHAAFLFADPWLKPGISGILVPFSIGYRPVWTALGIVAGYLAAVLGLSFYVRRRIGVRLWRRMHRATLAVYLLGLAHALGAGTDSGVPAVRYALLASIAPIVFLSALRALRSRTSAKRPAPLAEHQVLRGATRSHGEGGIRDHGAGGQRQARTGMSKRLAAGEGAPADSLAITRWEPAA